MVKTVVGVHHWLPFDVYRLFLDADDVLGLVYWFDDIESKYWHELDDKGRKEFTKGMTVDQLKFHDQIHNPDNEINKDTGEWFLK